MKSLRYRACSDVGFTLILSCMARTFQIGLLKSILASDLRSTSGGVIGEEPITGGRKTGQVHLSGSRRKSASSPCRASHCRGSLKWITLFWHAFASMLAIWPEQAAHGARRGLNPPVTSLSIRLLSARELRTPGTVKEGVCACQSFSHYAPILSG